MTKLEALTKWLDVLVPFIPFSLLGAFFGDAFRKDVLTRRQRAAAALLMIFLGPAAAQALVVEYGLSLYTGMVTAVLFSALGTDLIGLAAAVFAQVRQDPIGNIVKLRDLIPWRRS